jgi:hypothetical protein
MRPPRVSVLLCALLAFVPACEKDKPKPDDTKKVDPTPVPSGLVFNDFLPTTGGNAAGLGVRGDAGLEGGLAAVGGGTGEPGADPTNPGGQPGAPAAQKLRVTEPGGEPRALRKYTFVANKTDKRVLTLSQAVSQSMGGQTAPAQEQTIKLSVDVTPKTVKPTGATLEAKVAKVEIPGAPPNAQQVLAGLNGLAGTFEVTSHGEVGELQFQASPAMKNQMAEGILRALSQVVELLVAPFPDAPIGQGAKWEMGNEQGTKRFALKEVSGEGGVVDAEIDIKVPRHAQQGPQGRGMMFVEVDGKGKYTYQVKFNQVSPKVEGELTLNEKIEVNDPKAGGKQIVTQSQKAKHLVESGK